MAIGQKRNVRKPHIQAPSFLYAPNVKSICKHIVPRTHLRVTNPPPFDGESRRVCNIATYIAQARGAKAPLNHIRPRLSPIESSRENERGWVLGAPIYHARPLESDGGISARGLRPYICLRKYVGRLSGN